MSDAAQTQNSPTNTAEASTSAVQRGLWSSGLKVEQADGVPAEMVGKDIREIAQELERQKQIAETYRQAMSSPQAYQQQSYQQPPQQAASSFQGPIEPDPSLMYSNPQEYHRQLKAYNAWELDQKLGTLALPMANSLAVQARWQSTNDPEFSEVWRKYGHEIDALAMKVPVHQRDTNAYNTIANMVRGQHVNDFIEDRARALIASGGFGTERAAPNAGMPTQSLSALDRLFDAKSDHPQSVRYRTNNTSRADFLKYCGAMGKDPEAHANEILGGQVLAA